MHVKTFRKAHNVTAELVYAQHQTLDHDLDDCRQVDATFEDAEALQAIPRAVYALLRSPMLSHRSEAHPDLRTSLSLLWASLPPQDLWTAIYPHLSSWQDPETQVSYCCVAKNDASVCSTQDLIVISPLLMYALVCISYVTLCLPGDLCIAIEPELHQHGATIQPHCVHMCYTAVEPAVITPP